MVFIKEIVPKPALSFVANSIYKEHYETMRMKNQIHHNQNDFMIKYSWKGKNWHFIEITAETMHFQWKMIQNLNLSQSIITVLLKG